MTRGAIAVALCFTTATLAWGTVFYGHSVYMDALTAAHGWSARDISQAILVFWLASLPGTLSVGVLVDRFGSAGVVLLGGLLIGGGLTALAFTTEPWHLYPIYIALGFGYPSLAGTSISATLSYWFDKNFGFALAIALSGASAGGAVLPLLTVHLANRMGFSDAILHIGLTLAALVLITAFVFRTLGPPPYKLHATEKAAAPNFSARALLSRRRFWHIALAAAAGLGGQVGLLAHQIPIVLEKADQGTAALMVTVVAIASAVGRLGLGYLTRSIPATSLAAVSYVTHGAGIGWLAFADGTYSIWIASALAGFGVGAIVMLPPIIVRQYLGAANFGRTYAVANVVMYVMAGVSPFLVGVLHEATSGYSTGLWLLVGLEAAAAAAILALPARPAAS